MPSGYKGFDAPPMMQVYYASQPDELARAGFSEDMVFEQEPEERRKHADDRARVFQTQETARTKAGSQEEPALQEEIVCYMIIKKSVINR